MSVGLTVAALAFGGWRLVVPGVHGPSSETVDRAVGSMVTTIVEGSFTGAQASLEAQRSATGTYAGTALAAPLTLVRAEATSYCVQLDRPPLLQHLVGPGGTAASGAC